MIKLVFLLGVITAAALIGPRLYAGSGAVGRKVAEPGQIAPERVALVFGAGLTRSGQPTAMLYDRVASAADLYRQGAVKKLLMSGDNSTASYDEPGAMKRAALQLGVPEPDIVLDAAGSSTYDSCYRAQAIFGLQRVVLVTQDFHLDRALMICDGLGLQSQGFIADRRPYPGLRFNHLRELFATPKAAWDVFLAHPRPVLGEKITIP